MSLGALTKLAKIVPNLLALAGVGGSSNVGHDGPEPTVAAALDSRASGEPGKLYNLIAGAFRKDLLEGPVWKGIFDSSHQQSKMFEPTEGVELQLHYEGDNVGTMIVATDERFAAYGCTAGASVAKDNCFVRMGAPCEYSVDLTVPTAPTLEFDTRFYGAARFSADISDTGLITLGHPQLQGKKQPTVQYRAPTSQGAIAHVHALTTASPGQTTLFLLARMSGRISFGGSAWGTSFSPFNSLITFSAYDSVKGELTVTHPLLTDGNIVDLTNYTTTSVAESYDVALIASNNTSFTVRFRKKLDDSIPASIPTGVGFTFDRGLTAILPKTAIAGSLTVFLDVVQLDMRDVNFPLANLWTFGLMGKNKV